jgi:hypothetical protein
VVAATGTRAGPGAEPPAVPFLATAWRCPGSAVGQQLVYDFGRSVTLTAVGLVPGYAEVDPMDGTDRFAESRTVTAVKWRFDDRRMHRQTISSPGPGMVSVDLPRAVSTSEVVLEIAAPGTTPRSGTSCRSATSSSPSTGGPARRSGESAAPLRDLWGTCCSGEPERARQQRNDFQ